MAKGGARESSTSERRIAAIDRQRQALELRKAGVGYIQIAERLGYRGPSGAYGAVKSAIRLTLQEPADELRRLELERLDALSLALWPDARRGKLGAIDRLLGLMERRAKLLGLDMPTRQELSGPGGGPIEVDHAGLDDEERITRLVAIFDAARARRDRQADSASPAMGAIAGPADGGIPE